MELKQIKELMNAMGKTGMQKLRLKKEGFEIELEQAPPEEHSSVQWIEQPVSVSRVPSQPHVQVPHSGTEIASALRLPPKKEELVEESGVFITSPMVGTFYLSPSPEDPSFVKVGDTVSQDDVVCIIEAMKVMNEVKAGHGGAILEIFVENGHPVEFGTKLFKLSPG